MQGVGTPAIIDKDSVMLLNNQVRFSLQNPRSPILILPFKLFTLEKLLAPSLAYPVETLRSFVAASDQRRQGNRSNLLFLGLRPPHNSVGASTVARWLKRILKDAVVDT